MKLVPKILPRSDAQRRAEYERQLIRMEAKIGGQLFGPLPEGHHREFFCLDEHTWVWHEEWDQAGQHKVATTYYTLRPDTILKLQDGHYRELSKQEADNLYRAIKLYVKRVRSEYQQRLQAA